MIAEILQGLKKDSSDFLDEKPQDTTFAAINYNQALDDAITALEGIEDKIRRELIDFLYERYHGYTSDYEVSLDELFNILENFTPKDK